MSPGNGCEEFMTDWSVVCADRKLTAQCWKDVSPQINKLYINISSWGPGMCYPWQNISWLHKQFFLSSFKRKISVSCAQPYHMDRVHPVLESSVSMESSGQFPFCGICFHHCQNESRWNPREGLLGYFFSSQIVWNLGIDSYLYLENWPLFPSMSVFPQL